MKCHCEWDFSNCICKGNITFMNEIRKEKPGEPVVKKKDEFMIAIPMSMFESLIDTINQLARRQ